jgi:hypothetical protein
MSTDPVMSRTFTSFNSQYPTTPHSETDRAGVSWVRRQEESEFLAKGKTHEYIVEYLRTNPSVLAMIDYYSDENLAARVTSIKNVHEAAGVILSKLQLPLSEDTGYFYQLMAYVYRTHFNQLEAVEQAAEIEKYELVSVLIKGMNEILKIDDPHQKYEKLNLLLSELKGLYDVEIEKLEIAVKFSDWKMELTREKQAHERHTVEDFQLVYDFFYHYKFILGLAAIVLITNLYLLRAEKFTFKTARAIVGWTVYSSGLAWIGLNLVGIVVKKVVRAASPIFRYYTPAPKPRFHPLSKSMNEFIEKKLPKCYQAQLPQLIAKWQEAVWANYFCKSESSPVPR